MQVATSPYGQAAAAPREPEPTVAPNPADNEQDRVGRRSRIELARHVVNAHMSGLEARREGDLIREKLLLHVDGSGDFQWADIFYGTRVMIPRLISEFRKTENVLRILVDNAVAYHTSMELQYLAHSRPDRRSVDQGIIDTVWANHLSHEQDLKGLFAQGLYLAMPAGFCPIHRYWRDDANHDMQDPVGPVDEEEELLSHFLEPTVGTIDCWVGNPFGTVFDPGARRGSIQWASYERVLPADVVREHFDHVEGVRGLEGSTKIPSAAEFHRIAQNWRMEGLGIHGDPIMQTRRNSDDELITVVCREIAKGVSRQYPEGRLQIAAVPGATDLRHGKGRASQALLLADQPLPAGDYSFTIFYSHHRGSDVHGKPWVEDLDELQVSLNIAKSKRWEYINKMMESPIVAPGGAVSDDMATFGAYNLLEIDPSLANWRPRVMEWPQGIVTALNSEIDDLRRAMYTQGGYQAASRGEAPGSRMAYRAIVALQEADKTIHGPVNQRFRRAAIDFMKGCWRQMKRYGDVPWMVSITGDEYAHLVEPYVSNTQLSDAPPDYRLVNAFGASPEMRAQEIIELLGTKGADGQPFITTEEARRQYPNQTVFDNNLNPATVQRRRAKTVATRIVHDAQQIREHSGFEEWDLAHPWVQQFAQQLFQQAEQQYPRMRDDDLHAHINALSEITQDETADPIARLACQMRQDLYYEWQQMMAMGGGAPSGGGAPQSGMGGGGAPQRGGGMDRRAVAAEAQGGGGPGTTLSDVDAGGPAAGMM